MHPEHIMVLGIGCTLFSDDGFGINVIQMLEQRYSFPDNVEIVDGGLLGVSLLGYISLPDHLIVIDTMCNNGNPGDIYRLDAAEIKQRLLTKNSVQQVEFLEAFAHLQALEKVPRTIMFAVEPDDYKTCSCELTPIIALKVDTVIRMIVDELKGLGVRADRKGA
ncbi:MAG: hydrogenase maturation protease [Desulfobacteraceae bacterium]|nr:hydrogenase maturation protease [Desulfobacteraceae bacterium]